MQAPTAVRPVPATAIGPPEQAGRGATSRSSDLHVRSKVARRDAGREVGVPHRAAVDTVDKPRSVTTGTRCAVGHRAGCQAGGVATQAPTAQAIALARRGDRSLTVVGRTERAQHRRHPGLAQHRQAHAPGMGLERGEQRRHVGVQQLGQAAPADRLEAARGVVGDARRAVGRGSSRGRGRRRTGSWRRPGPTASGSSRVMTWAPACRSALADGATERPEAAQLADHDALVGQVGAGPAQVLVLAHGGHGRVAGAVGHPAEGLRASRGRRSRRGGGRCCAGTRPAPRGRAARRCRRPGRRRSRAGRRGPGARRRRRPAAWASGRYSSRSPSAPAGLDQRGPGRRRRRRRRGAARATAWKARTAGLGRRRRTRPGSDAPGREAAPASRRRWRSRTAFAGAGRASAGGRRPGIRTAPRAAAPCPWRRRGASWATPSLNTMQRRDAHHVEAPGDVGVARRR